MKRKLYIVGVIFISLVTFSCSNDDLENLESENNIVKRSEKVLLNELNEQAIDSTTVIAPGGNKSEQSTTDSDGEPSNPKPPRK